MTIAGRQTLLVKNTRRFCFLASKKLSELIRNNGGKVVSMYAVLGEHDLVFTLDFPDAEKAPTTSGALNKLTGISFTTSPVVEVEKFDKLMTEARKI